MESNEGMARDVYFPCTANSLHRTLHTISPVLDKYQHHFTQMLKTRQFEEADFDRVSGDRLHEWIQNTGFRKPVIIESPEDLDMLMPDACLKVSFDIQPLLHNIC